MDFSTATGLQILIGTPGSSQAMYQIYAIQIMVSISSVYMVMHCYLVLQTHLLSTNTSIVFGGA